MIKKFHSFLLIILLSAVIFSCGENTSNIVKVNDIDALKSAIEDSQPGTEIVMANKNWKDVSIDFIAKGTENAPIVLRAETPGEVIISGLSNLKFGGEFLEVRGLHFKEGHSPDEAVINFRIDSITAAYHCAVVNCVIEDFNKPNRDDSDRWIQFWGRHNRLENCYVAGKTNRGPTIRVDLEGNEHIYNYHQIVGNHFGPRPPKGGPSGETIQIGDSYTSMTPSHTFVADNLFDQCDGEVEIISSKSNFNEFRNNVFYQSEGSLVTRHGNYCFIDGNYFIGDGVNENFGGIRVINTGHWITNNYFYNLIGENFRSPLAVMNGIPKSPLNRYNQVTDVVVAYNTYINCKEPWQFGVGTNIDQKDVLPASEIRSARPIRTIVANNVIYNKKGDPSPIVEHDKADGVTFKSNVINNKGIEFNRVEGLDTKDFELKEIGKEVFTAADLDVDAYQGFEFERISKDIFGNPRGERSIGAISNSSVAKPTILDKSKYGPSWFSDEVEEKEPQIFEVTTPDELQSRLAEAKNGDIISVANGTYEVSNSIVITKKITIMGKEDATPVLQFLGKENSPLFELQPKGFLTLKNIELKGLNTQYAFATLKENMYTHFGLTVEGSDISDFNYVLKVYKQSFAESITFKNSTIKDCKNGLELSQETNDKGDYNTEYLTIDNCQFSKVEQNVIDYYRGGYDESTIGGNLLVSNSTFTNCGYNEKNKMLLNHRGIINVNITKNTFENNSVDFVSILWGAKNNVESENNLINSGIIKTEENLKLKLMY